MSASRRSSENPTKTNKREGSHSKSPALISVRLNEWPRTSSASTARRAGKGGWPAGAKSDGRFGKQDFAYLPKEDVYRCPAGERLPYGESAARKRSSPADAFRKQLNRWKAEGQKLQKQYDKLKQRGEVQHIEMFELGFEPLLVEITPINIDSFPTAPGAPPGLNDPA